MTIDTTPARPSRPSTRPGTHAVRRLAVPFALLACVLLSTPALGQTIIGGVDLGNLPEYMFYFGDANGDANWQGATKGFTGDVAVSSRAGQRTSGGVPYAGTIYTDDSIQGAWQGIVDQNRIPDITFDQAFGIVTNETTRLAGLEADINSAFTQINGLSATAGYDGVSSTFIDGLNTTNGVAETFVIDITSGLDTGDQIDITGDPGDVYIIRWDDDNNTANGYQGQVKFNGCGGIVPHGGLSPSNFIHVAGDINSSGGCSSPPSDVVAFYPSGPRIGNGQGALADGATEFSSGGFFTGFWLTTGSPDNPADATWDVPYGNSSSMSNGIFIGGWYTINTSFSMTSGTSSSYVGPVDYGDLPEGTGYLTTRKTSGPSGPGHVISELLFMGTTMATDLDSEGDGQPDATATGDDTNNDDEQAVSFPTFSPGQSADVTVSVTNNSGATATLYGFIDWNNDGDFLDTGEAVTTTVADATVGNATLSFSVPAGAVTGTPVGARFRLSTDAALTATDPPGDNGPIPAPDGEVEDYLVTVVGELDYGDAPDSYGTLSGSNGPNHALVAGPYLGSVPGDADTDGQPVDQDDAVGVDDEDGIVTTPTIVTTDASVSLNVDVTATGQSYLACWIDFDLSGTFDADEREEVTVAATGTETLVFTTPGDVQAGASWIRCRISTDQASVALPTGGAPDGEVEDYPVTINEPEPQDLDFGDLPDPNYPTLLASDGARHVILPQCYLGQTVDIDADGQQNANADGDDSDGTDDEDGILFVDATPDPGATEQVLVEAVVDGCLSPPVLYCWADWNADGDFADPLEDAISGLALTTGVTPTTVNVPLDANTVAVFMRCRMSSDNAAAAVTGLAQDGEVEDYVLALTLPVELTAFTAVPVGQSVELSWETASEANNAGFSIEMAAQDDSFEEIGFVQGAGSTTEASSYDYRVDNLNFGPHRFRLKQVNFDGSFAYSQELEVAIDLPFDYMLEPVYPNPFNPQATVRFAVKEAEAVRVELYTALGQLVRVLYDGTPDAGRSQVVRIDGAGLPSGTYLVRLVSPNFSTSQMVTLLK